MSFENIEQEQDSLARIDRFIDFIDEEVIGCYIGYGPDSSDLTVVGSILTEIFVSRVTNAPLAKRAIIKSTLIYRERNPINSYIPLDRLQEMPHTPVGISKKNYANYVNKMEKKILKHRAVLESRGMVFPNSNSAESINTIAVFLQWAKSAYESE